MKEYLPSLRDLHLYGGALIASVGFYFIDWHVALVVLGIYLVYLGEPWR